jgi:hypothetical protein
VLAEFFGKSGVVVSPQLGIYDPQRALLRELHDQPVGLDRRRLMVRGLLRHQEQGGDHVGRDAQRAEGALHHREHA